MRLLSSTITALLHFYHSSLAHRDCGSSFKLDVHSHLVPDIYRAALIEAGYPVKDGVVYTDGFPVPAWNLETHIRSMDTQGLNYSTLSFTAPGIGFLAHDPPKAARLARELNLVMFNYTKAYPKRLGAMCLLPLPDIDSSLAEIKYCLDSLHFDGVGLYTNFAGTYLGDPVLNPILQALHDRQATVFVHPSEPGCATAGMGYPSPLTEYPFDSVRAMQKMLLTGQRQKYPAINIIFPHGGGALPYLAARIAYVAQLSVNGNLDPETSMRQFRGYYFDTAGASSAIQLSSMNLLGGVGKIVTGTDYPYVPVAAGAASLAAVQANGNFSTAEMARIHGLNALGIFPAVARKLGCRRL
ncbi:hypothetical protein LZ554_003508 [Drepanopeziza brunnea f. sp. 'monogermtubi']|nr:hypothetical protein LZ554_003508 [Drepanopeziza brunnea f. sp. 'monogermtubi']